MKDKIIREIESLMLYTLTNGQVKKLHEALVTSLANVTLSEKKDCDIKTDISGERLLDTFIAAKRIEGCSEKSLKYYDGTIVKMFESIKKPIVHITTDDLRKYLAEYQRAHQSSKVTIDNMRRILSSFFAWLEDEDYIMKSPVRRIHKIKIGKIVKDTYTDEALELMRDKCSTLRDLAMIDFLTSTGIRVGELVGLNHENIDFHERSCVVTGKGNKQREVYFDARTKIHLQNYLASRKDTNPALFTALAKPYKRLQIGGVELRLREMGKQLGLPKVHPHKFRRTLATTAIDKGMPIEQLQQLLGHQKIDTTLQYAMVKQQNVKMAHRKYIG